MMPAKEREIQERRQRIASGELTRAEAKAAYRKEQQNEFERGMKAMSYHDAKRVYGAASADEKEIIAPILRKKAVNLVHRNPAEAEREGVE